MTKEEEEKRGFNQIREEEKGEKRRRRPDPRPYAPKSRFFKIKLCCGKLRVVTLIHYVYSVSGSGPAMASALWHPSMMLFSQVLRTHTTREDPLRDHEMY